MIKVNNLTFAYGQNLILENITFEVAKKEFLGIIGPNGSGKSTLLRLLANLLKPSKGNIRISDALIHDYSIKELAKIMAVVPEETLITFPFTVEDLVLMGRTPHLSFLESAKSEDLKIIERVSRQTDIKHLSHRLINELSSGERQRVFIAQALAQEPRILLLDEPTAHLDINHQMEIFNLLKDLQTANGLTIVVVSHDLNLAALYCQKLLLLNKTRIFARGTPEEVITTENLKSVYQANVLVHKDPTTFKPQISLIPKKEEKKENE